MGKNVVIEVEDECGGLNSDAIKNLFKPFVSGGFDQSGLGLGLTIVQRTVTMLRGKISHQNSPGRGCGFRIEVPKVLVPVALNRAVEGVSSAQPNPAVRDQTRGARTFELVTLLGVVWSFALIVFGLISEMA